MEKDYEAHLSQLIRQYRLAVPLTLQQLAKASGVSVSHLGRIERGERYPSGHTLKRIAKPLGFEEDELFTIAGYLSPDTPAISEQHQSYTGVDPYISRMLSQEPLEVQRMVIGILSILKSLARSMNKKNNHNH